MSRAARKQPQDIFKIKKRLMKQPSIGVPKQAATEATFIRVIAESTSPHRVTGRDSLGASDGNNLIVGRHTTFSSKTGVWQPGVRVV